MGRSGAFSWRRDGSSAAGPRRVLWRASVAVLGVSLAVTGVVTWLTGHVVGDQEHKLLVERSGEINLLLEQTLTSVSTQLTSLGHLATTEHEPGLFLTEARADLSDPSSQAIALLAPHGPPGGWQVVSAAGAGLAAGQVLSAVPAATAHDSTLAAGMVATPVYGSGMARRIGFAVATGSGMVVYRQTVLGPVKPPKAAGATAFSDVRVVLYAGSRRADPTQVLTTTAPDLPLRGSVVYRPYMAGRSSWLLGVQAAHPLVGSVAESAPWAVLMVGLAGAGLVFVVMEGAVRRRNAALQLYESEHRFAETLQRRLLSPLMSPPGLDVASRYVAASDLQQVGGDWFDVFALGDGRVGVVIGDVMGHDVEAAAAMAQVRAGLRAYAIEGDAPAAVLSRLARFIDAFEIALLVTLVYGVIEPPDSDGARVFTWANAGHLPPILHRPDGAVSELLGGTSPVLGAPCDQNRTQRSAVVSVGSTILLYTDGLIEVHGVDLSESLDSLCAALSNGAGAGSAEQICEAVLEFQSREQRFDDIALVAVQVETVGRRPTPAEGAVVSAR